MADIYKPNKPMIIQGDWFSIAWFMTRLMQQAGWLHMASSDGTAKVTTVDPVTNKWGTLSTLAGQTGAVASIGAKFGKDFLFTGLTGLVSPVKTNQGGSEGNYLVVTGAASGGNNTTWQISQVLSSTSCYARPVAGSTPVADDANNGAISWTEKDAKSLAYIVPANSMWIVLRGPSTLKIPFVVAPAGPAPFIRGENIVQAATGAEGECLGVTYEPSTGVGFMVVSPRLMGTGTGRQGWDQDGTATYVITGSKSSATVFPCISGTSAIAEFVREVMFQRSTDTIGGTIYYGCFDVVSESAQLFTTLAASAGCTATIAPGEGGTGNGFPAVAITIAGTGGSTGHCTSLWDKSAISSSSRFGNVQYFCANCIERQNVSQDGSYLCVIGHNQQGTQSTGAMPYLMRCDNGDDGDLDPYVYWISGATNNPQPGNRSRTSFTFNNNFSVDSWILIGHYGTNGNNFSPYVGYRRRGYPTDDTFSEYQAWFLFPQGASGLTFIEAEKSLTDPETVAHSVQTTLPRVINFPTIAWAGGNTTFPSFGVKARKGTPRWTGCVQGNVAYDTFGGKTWLQAGLCLNADINNVPMVVPWDGSTTPIQ